MLKLIIPNKNNQKKIIRKGIGSTAFNQKYSTTMAMCDCVKKEEDLNHILMWAKD